MGNARGGPARRARVGSRGGGAALGGARQMVVIISDSSDEVVGEPIEVVSELAVSVPCPVPIVASVEDSRPPPARMRRPVQGGSLIRLGGELEPSPLGLDEIGDMAARARLGRGMLERVVRDIETNQHAVSDLTAEIADLIQRGGTDEDVEGKRAERRRLWKELEAIEIELHTAIARATAMARTPMAVAP